MLRKPILLIVLVLFLDQCLKIWIKTNMMLGQEHHIFDWFIIHFTENKGMAFGMEFGGEIGKYFLSIFRIVAIGFIAVYLKKLATQNVKKGILYSIALILAGAIGNMIDSAFYGLIFFRKLRPASHCISRRVCRSFARQGGRHVLLSPHQQSLS